MKKIRGSKRWICRWISVCVCCFVMLFWAEQVGAQQTGVTQTGTSLADATQIDTTQIDTTQVYATQAEVENTYVEQQAETGVEATGQFSSSVTWTLDEEGVFTISGAGEWEAQELDCVEQIKKVVVSSNVTMIPEKLFFSTGAELTEVVFKDRTGECTIGTSAFQTKIETMTFGKGTYYIGSSIVRNSLYELNFSDGSYYLEEYAFSQGYMKSLNIEGATMNIGEYAFSFTSIVSLYMNDANIIMQDMAFYRCVSLKEIYFGDGYYQIGEYAFSNYYQRASIEKIVFGEGNYYLGAYAFSYNAKLSYISIRDCSKIRQVSENTFEKCDSLSYIYATNISYPIGYYFDITDNLTSISAEYEGEAVVEGTSLIRAYVKVICNSSIFGKYELSGYNQLVKFNSLLINGVGAGENYIDVSVYSQVCKLKVPRKAKTAISIEPDYMGIVTDGMILSKDKVYIQIKYDNGTTSEILGNDENVTYSDLRMYDDGSGKASITVVYCGLKGVLEVDIVESIPEAISADYEGIVTEGCLIDLSQLVVMLIYNDGQQEEITEYDISDYEIKVGNNVITIYYKEFMTEVSIEGVEKEISGLSASYDGQVTQGMQIDKEKLTVTAYYNNNTSAQVTDYTISDYEIGVGTNQLEILYSGISTTVFVTGIEKELIAIEAKYMGEAVLEGTSIETDKVDVFAYFNNGTKQLIKAYVIDEYMIVAGENQITVFYGTKQTKMSVTGKEKSLTDISATYNGNVLEGMTLDKSKIQVIGFYNNLTSQVMEEYEVGNYQIVAGINSVKITVGDKECMMIVEGKKKSPVGLIAVFSGEVKEGTPIGRNTLVVQLCYDNNTKEVIHDYEFDEGTLKLGDNTIQISYQGLKTLLIVNCKETLTGSEEDSGTTEKEEQKDDNNTEESDETDSSANPEDKNETDETNGSGSTEEPDETDGSGSTEGTDGTDGSGSTEGTDGSGSAEGTDGTDGSGSTEGTDGTNGSGSTEGTDGTDGSGSTEGTDETDGSGSTERTDGTDGNDNREDGDGAKENDSTKNPDGADGSKSAENTKEVGKTDDLKETAKKEQSTQSQSNSQISNLKKEKLVITDIITNANLKIVVSSQKIKSKYMTKKAIQLTWDKVFNKNGQVYYKIVKKGQKASDKKWKRQKKSSLVIKKNMQAYVLVKVVDSSGNVYKWRTQTFIIDKTKPQIKGVKNQKEYTQKVCVKIKDKQSGISKVLCNGKNITKKLTKKGKITFTKKGIYQLVVVNGCGRKKKITFTMK